jgi:hypothetical protein
MDDKLAVGFSESASVETGCTVASMPRLSIVSGDFEQTAVTGSCRSISFSVDSFSGINNKTVVWTQDITASSTNPTEPYM